MRPVNRLFSAFSTSPGANTKPSSWAEDLVHPLPLAAVAVLAVNDHLLKGASILPTWITGKLSDFAGLFFFPVLLAAVARGVGRLARVAPASPKERDFRAFLAVGMPALTALGFAAVKLSAFVNERVAATWGVMVMDATDLWALLMLPLSAAFLLRGRTSSATPAERAPARRALDFAAVLAAGLASAATSAPNQPPPAVPPQPIAQPVAIAVAEEPAECASLTISVCERSASRTFVVVEATATGRRSCSIQLARAVELTPGLAEVEPERLPAPITVKEGNTATFSLSFLRPVAPEEQDGTASLRLMVSRAHDSSEAVLEPMELARTCVAR